MAVTRAVSPIHLEYLRNMGVAASMSVSILRRCKLWGLDERIHAPARAHDRLTQRELGWVSLKSLIRTELQAFLASKSERVRGEGDDIDLSPTAFTTMALVMHELVTNSAKYGTLNDNSGVVHLDLTVNQDGSAAIHWREIGGPPVKAPTRKGFGTTIIERSVPFELSGTASVAHKIAGLEPSFTLPGRHVKVSRTPEPVTDSTEAPQSVQDPAASGSRLRRNRVGRSHSRP